MSNILLKHWQSAIVSQTVFSEPNLLAPNRPATWYSREYQMPSVMFSCSILEKYPAYTHTILKNSNFRLLLCSIRCIWRSMRTLVFTASNIRSITIGHELCEKHVWNPEKFVHIYNTRECMIESKRHTWCIKHCSCNFDQTSAKLRYDTTSVKLWRVQKVHFSCNSPNSSPSVISVCSKWAHFRKAFT